MINEKVIFYFNHFIAFIYPFRMHFQKESNSCRNCTEAWRRKKTGYGIHILSLIHIYEYKYGTSLSLRLCGILGAEKFCWTLRSEDEVKSAQKYFSAFIFEKFIPDGKESFVL